jgi:pimeloyl-ACP methyl ester carboxylesterase
LNSAVAVLEGVECRVLYGGSRGPPVLLLHGFSFRGDTWREAGVLGALEERGIRYAAPDMPYGRATECTSRTRDLWFNVEFAWEVVSRFLGGEPPVVVGASLGGRVALYLAASRGARGLVLVAPALRGRELELGVRRRLRGVPALVLWGDRDRVVPRWVVEWVAGELGAELKVYRGAGHALYLDRPGEFVEDLMRFIEGLGG